MTILLTWWAWFIGSHTAVACLEAGYDVVILDNYSNSDPSVIDRIQSITTMTLTSYQGDVRDADLVAKIFETHTISAVIHFAAKKAVGESCKDPRLYYEENIVWLTTLTKVMHHYGCKHIVFSSSCTVYDPLASVAPFDESAPTGNNFSPYGTTKQVCEMLLRDLSLHQWWSGIALRYFNPIGAHASGLIGEHPHQAATNLLPIIMQVATSKQSQLQVFWNTYDTPDGTCLRDYIHVMDLAQAHVAALRYLLQWEQPSIEYINIGTWVATSVLEIITSVSSITHREIPYQIAAARAWDIPIAYANPYKAQQLLWRTAQYNVTDAVTDAWHFIQSY